MTYFIPSSSFLEKKCGGGGMKREIQAPVRFFSYDCSLFKAFFFFWLFSKKRTLLHTVSSIFFKKVFKSSELGIELTKNILLNL